MFEQSLSMLPRLSPSLSENSSGPACVIRSLRGELTGKLLLCACVDDKLHMNGTNIDAKRITLALYLSIINAISVHVRSLLTPNACKTCFCSCVLSIAAFDSADRSLQHVRHSNVKIVKALTRISLIHCPLART